MTVTVQTGRNNYVGNDSTTAFAYTFRIVDEADIEVRVDNVVQVLTTDYTVSGVGDAGGGTVTFITAPTSVAVSLIGKQPVDQDSNYVLNEDLPSERIEKDLDKLVMIARTLEEAINRAVTFKPSSTLTGKVIDDLVAGKYFLVKSDLSGIQMGDLTGAGTITIPVPVADGGTGGATAAAARTQLDVMQAVFTTRGDLSRGGVGGVAERVGLGAVDAFFVSDGTDGLWETIHAIKSKVTPRGYLAGLDLSNNGSDATNDIDIAVGECLDDANASFLERTAVLVKQIDAAWAVGTDAGGMDTGAVADDTWYHVWLIRRSDTGVVDVLFSLSASAPTMPTDYDEKRHLGFVRRLTAANMLVTQIGDESLIENPPLDIDVSNPGTAAVSRTLTVPPGFQVLALLNAMIDADGVASSLYLSSLDVDDEAASTTAAPLGQVHAETGAITKLATAEVRTDISSAIRSRVSGSDASTNFRIVTKGWRYTRGRDA